MITGAILASHHIEAFRQIVGEQYVFFDEESLATGLGRLRAGDTATECIVALINAAHVHACIRGQAVLTSAV